MVFLVPFQDRQQGWVGYPRKLCFPRQSEGLVIHRDVMGVRRGCHCSDNGLCLCQERA